MPPSDTPPPSHIAVSSQLSTLHFCHTRSRLGGSSAGPCGSVSFRAEELIMTCSASAISTRKCRAEGPPSPTPSTRARYLQVKVCLCYIRWAIRWDLIFSSTLHPTRFSNIDNSTLVNATFADVHLRQLALSSLGNLGGNRAMRYLADMNVTP
jgi:hypothetical protein